MCCTFLHIIHPQKEEGIFCSSRSCRPNSGMKPSVMITACSPTQKNLFVFARVWKVTTSSAVNVNGWYIFTARICFICKPEHCFFVSQWCEIPVLLHAFHFATPQSHRCWQTGNDAVNKSDHADLGSAELFSNSPRATNVLGSKCFLHLHPHNSHYDFYSISHAVMEYFSSSFNHNDSLSILHLVAWYRHLTAARNLNWNTF